MGFLLSGVNLFAVNGFRDGAEIPGDTPLTVEFLLSPLAQLVLRDESGHNHHLLFHGVKGVYHIFFREDMPTQ